MAMVQMVRDDRDGEIEAHCELVDPATYTWRVELFSPKGLRGAFDISLPPGVDQSKAISKELQARGIHASSEIK